MAVIYEIIGRLIVYSCFLLSVSAIKLNVPRVLLPFSQSVSANFTLEVTNGGCFKWFVSRPEVVRLYVLYEEDKDCSSRAVVSSTSKVPTQQSALVTLTNDVTGESLHCDVVVTSIYELEITTTTREVLMEDTPEAFAVRAKDKDGDTFSSLDGLVFQWNILSDVEIIDTPDASGILSFMKFSESLYKASSAIYALEAKGLRGYTVLVQGIKTGTAKVRATLKDDAYPQTLSTEVTLTVVANLVLFPSYEVHLVVGSILTYQVLLIQHGKAQRMPMPSGQFYLEVEDESIARLNSKTSEVEALSSGYTLVVLKDRNIKTRQTFRQPSAGIHVAAAHHIGFTVFPHENWHLIYEREYIILIKLYDRDNNEIYNTENMRIQATFPDDYFKVISKTQNGTFYHVLTKKIGITTIAAKWEGILQKNGYISEAYPALESSQDMEIMDRVYILPELVILPWDPIAKPSYKVSLKAFGGGNYGYVWKSANPAIATCSQTGEVISRSNGSVHITAASARNLHDFGITSVNVLVPNTLEILDTTVEVNVGNIVYLPIALYTYLDPSQKSRVAFTDCTLYSFDVEVTDPSKLEYLEEKDFPTIEGSCASLPFRGLAEGFVHVHISLRDRENDIKTSTVIGIYHSLNQISPTHTKGVVVLAVGSSLSLAFSGGPRPWALTPQTYFRHVAVENTALAALQMEDDIMPRNEELHIFSVLCRTVGEAVAFLIVGNNISAYNPMPVVAKTEIRIACAVPTVVELQPVVARPDDSNLRCSLDQRRVASQCYQDLDINVLLKDQEGRLFDNFTSLAFAWECSDLNLATVTTKTALITFDNVFDGYRTVNRSYETIHVTGMEGLLKVSVKVQSYHEDVLISQGIDVVSHFESEVMAALYLDLVDDAHFTQDSISVFNHPENKVSLSVVKGSGQFDFKTREQGYATIQYDEKLHQFEIIPQMDGTFTLFLFDLCLAAKHHASVVIHISGIQKVEVNLVDKVGLDKQVTSTVRVLDQEGNRLPSSVFSLLEIRPLPSSDIISVGEFPEISIAKQAFQFSVLGRSLGYATLAFVVGLKGPFGSDVSSQKVSDAQPIQVFSPLQLFPRNITLIIGAVFQVFSSGGPHPQVNIEYTISNSKIASVNGSGIIEGLSLGNSLITGRAVGIDTETGSKIIYSQDHISVYVVPLTGIHIHTPLTRMQSGTTIPVYAFGVNEHETPFAFGSTSPPLIFKWSISNKEVAVLLPLYRQCGVHLHDSNHFMMHLTAKQQGQVTLSLTVSLSSPSSHGLYQIQDDAVLHDEIQIQVFEKFVLISPSVESQDITMTPNTDLRLLSNKDQASIINYRISDSSCHGKQGDISVSRTGILTSGKSLCSASLFITSVDEISGNQTFSSLISVKPISFMLITALCSLHAQSELLSVLPVGTRTLFRIQYHDIIGKEFQATNSRFKYFLSRNDLVQVMRGPKNNTFYIKSNNPGITVLKTWDAENVGIEDYLLIITGEVIEPSRKSLILGDRICFSSPLVSSEGLHGTWYADNHNVLNIKPHSGIGFVTDLGSSVVFYNISKSIVTSTEIFVFPIEAIKFHQSSLGKVLTNAHPGQVFQFPVILQNGELATHYHFANLHGKDCKAEEESSHNVPFKCILEFSNQTIDNHILDIFEIAAKFDFNTRYHICSIQTKSVSTLLQLKLSTLDTDMMLFITVPERTKQGQVMSEALRLPFHPAFHVHSLELQISDLQPSTTNLAISASTHVSAHLRVKSNDTSLVEVLHPVKDVTNSYITLYPVQLSEQFWKRASEDETKFDVHISITCSVTNQEVIVPVTIKILGDILGKCPADMERAGWRGLFKAVAENYQNLLIIILSIVGTMIALFIGYHAILGQKYYAAGPHTGVYLNQSGGGGEGRMYPAGTPGFGTPPFSAERPHLWSIGEPVRGSPSFRRTPSPKFHLSGDRF